MIEERDPTQAPEATNREQDDEPSQAQSVAEEAIARRADAFGLSDSEKILVGDETDDVQDLVDHMRQMEASGRIDMDAYRGERNDDDEEDSLGEGGVDR